MHSFLCGIRHGVLRDTELDQGSLDNEESGAREAEDDDVDSSDWGTGTRGLLHYAESTRQAEGQVGLAVLGQNFSAATCAAAQLRC